jgi:hypothetical protein
LFSLALKKPYSGLRRFWRLIFLFLIVDVRKNQRQQALKRKMLFSTHY